MPELIAQGSEPTDRWRKKLAENVTEEIGRASGAWSIPWDERISRQHIAVTLRGDKLHVIVLPSARNPVFYRGRKMPEFMAAAGEHFVIGGTTFMLANAQAEVSLKAPPPDNQRTFSHAELRSKPYRRADERIDALSRLPAIIQASGSDDELCGGLSNVLLAGIPQATAVAVVALETNSNKIAVLFWDYPRLTERPLAPSESLIRQALEQQASVVHVWSAANEPSADYTLATGVDWAACVPLGSESTGLWAVYLTGRFPEEINADAENLRDEMKFAELAAATFRNLREVQRLTRQEGALAQFLSPPVLNYIRGQDLEEVLAPREVEVSVLFCDLRGFSLESERLAGRLSELLTRVSLSLGTMSRRILETGGVIGDFHGDAAMGFWGWPLAGLDAPLQACRTALAIRRDFLASEWRGANRRSDFRIGIGIATGRAVAGKIGTADQVKVTVLGPVVNVASRLEALTKKIEAPILMDGPTADALRTYADRDLARARRVALVRPAGMETVVDLHELLPTEAELPELRTADLETYEEAWKALLRGDALQAHVLLQQVPPADRVREFLAQVLQRHAAQDPQLWRGVVEF